MSSKIVPLEAVRFLSSASPAHGARLFEWEGGLYRGVRPGSAALFERLLKEGVLQELSEKKLLIKSEVAPFQLEGYSMVLQHPRLPFLTYPFEWSAAALKEAALAQARLNLELLRYGVICHDSHPWNIVFDGANPVFVDLGSIVPFSEVNPSAPTREFDSYFTYPLRLMARGQTRVARHLLTDVVTGISAKEAAALGDFRARYDVVKKLTLMGRRFRRSYYKRTGRQASAAEFAPVWQEAEQDISSIQLQRGTSLWSEYNAAPAPLDKPSTPKEQAMAATLARLKPKTVLDLGCNTGWYSLLAAHLGASVAAGDIDDNCLERLYLEVKEKKMGVTTAYLNLRAPSPSHGWGGTRFPSAMERLKAECVMALALVHHLVFSQFADFEQIVDALCQFTTRHLIVEFISREDQFVGKWWKPGYEWYTLENFTGILGRRFNKIELIPSFPHGRTLIVCEQIK